MKERQKDGLKCKNSTRFRIAIKTEFEQFIANAHLYGKMIACFTFG